MKKTIREYNACPRVLYDTSSKEGTVHNRVVVMILCVAEVLQHAGRKCCSEPDTSFFFPAVFVMEAK